MTDRIQHPRVSRRFRKGYHIDLSDLHAQCEANYHRLMRLFPGYEQQTRCAFEAGDAQIELEVTARDRYTTEMRLRYQGRFPSRAQRAPLALSRRPYGGSRALQDIQTFRGSLSVSESGDVAARREISAEPLRSRAHGVLSQ